MGARWYDPALGRWLSADTIIPDFTNPQSLNRYTYCLGNPLGYVDPSGHTPWWVRRVVWQLGMMAFSGAGGTLVPLLHGRYDVEDNADTIRRLAPQELDLIVAASIAHQASDPKDRPFGSAIIDVGASQGIAQLRPGEVERWAPDYAGGSRQDSEVAIAAMSGKLDYANNAIFAAQAGTGRGISKTDQYMLLALTQNCSEEAHIQKTVSTFFASQGNWDDAFGTRYAAEWNWKVQLRLMVLHIDWLLANGWALPEGVDIEYMAEKAFED